MSFNADLSQQFAKFAGREVNAVEKTETLKLKHLGDITVTSVHIDDKDPAVAELAAAVAAAGLQLRLWAPGMMGTMDFRTDRLNANVEKAPDGKYRLGHSFTLG